MYGELYMAYCVFQLFRITHIILKEVINERKGMIYVIYTHKYIIVRENRYWLRAIATAQNLRLHVTFRFIFFLKVSWY